MFSFLCRGLSAVLAAFGKFKVPGRPRTHVARSPSDCHKHLWMVQSAGSSKDRRRKSACGRSGRLSLASSLAKATRKSIQNRFWEAPGHPKSTQKSVPGPSRDAPWRPRAYRERLGRVSGRPRRAPGASGELPKTARDAKTDVQDRPEARRGGQNRSQVASGDDKTEFFSRGALAKHRQNDFSSILVNFCFFCNVCEPLKVLRLPAKTEVRPFAQRVESLTRWNLGKGRK